MTKNSRVISGILASVLFFVTPFAKADYCCPEWLEALCPFAGIDAKVMRVAGRRDWWMLFPKIYGLGNVYVGFKFHENFGLEFGYEQSNRRKHFYRFTQHKRFFRFLLPGFSQERSVRFQLWHVDMNYYIALDHCFDFILSVGGALIRPEMNLIQNSPPRDGLERALVRMRLGQKGIFRARVGLQYDMLDWMGVRGLLGFDNTAHISINHDNKPSFERRRIPIRVFKDAFSVSLGVYFKFP